jgi:hypothetical protein
MGKLVSSPKENQIYAIEVEVEEQCKFFLLMELNSTTKSYRKYICFLILVHSPSTRYKQFNKIVLSIYPLVVGDGTEQVIGR